MARKEPFSVIILALFPRIILFNLGSSLVDFVICFENTTTTIALKTESTNLSLLDSSGFNQSESPSCYITSSGGEDPNSPNVWKLVFEDNFQSMNLSDIEWDVQHESIFCGGK